MDPNQAEVSTDDLVEAMVGRHVEDFFPSRDSAIGEMALELRDVRITSDARWYACRCAGPRSSASSA